MLGMPESDASAAAATPLRWRRLCGSACETHSGAPPPRSTLSHGAKHRRMRASWSPSLCRQGGLDNPGFAAILEGSTEVWVDHCYQRSTSASRHLAYPSVQGNVRFLHCCKLGTDSEVQLYELVPTVQMNEMSVVVIFDTANQRPG